MYLSGKNVVWAHDTMMEVVLGVSVSIPLSSGSWVAIMEILQDIQVKYFTQTEDLELGYL